MTPFASAGAHARLSAREDALTQGLDLDHLRQQRGAYEDRLILIDFIRIVSARKASRAQRRIHEGLD